MGGIRQISPGQSGSLFGAGRLNQLAPSGGPVRQVDDLYSGQLNDRLANWSQGPVSGLVSPAVNPVTNPGAPGGMPGVSYKGDPAVTPAPGPVPGQMNNSLQSGVASAPVNKPMRIGRPQRAKVPVGINQPEVPTRRMSMF